MARRRRWPYVVLGIAIVLVFVGIGAVIATVAWFQENMEVASSTRRDAETEFDSRAAEVCRPRTTPRAARRRTAFHEGRDETHVVSLDAPSQTLNVLVWDPDEEKVFRIAPAVLAAAAEIGSDPVRRLRVGIRR